VKAQSTLSISQPSSLKSTAAPAAGQSTSNVLLHPTAGHRPPAESYPSCELPLCAVDQGLIEAIIEQLQRSVNGSQNVINAVGTRLAIEVTRICRKSDRIQASGKVNTWQLSLAENRLNKYIEYYKLGSRNGRTELHSRLSAIAYRYIAPAQAQLGFQARCNLLEDFLQGFYIEVLKAFRRENHVEPDYTPRNRLELAEYMAFSEQYAKRRISLPGCYNQQLVVLRA